MWAYAAALMVIGVVSRLPQLLSSNLLLDGDECVLGLMAKHLAQGREFPIFFYGQHYGFSSIEAVAGALNFLAFGVGPLQLKTAMLALWLVGVLFLFLAQTRLLGTSRSFWITAVFLLTPAWAAWSMKARGGYLTAFTATAVLLWLLVRDQPRGTTMRWLAAGALTAVIYLAQPLWLPSVLPIVIVVLVLDRRWSWALIYCALIVGVVVIVTAATSVDQDVWSRPVLGNRDLAGSLPLIAKQLYVNLTGAYYLYTPIEPPGPATKLLSLLWCAVLPALVAVQIYRLVTRNYCVQSHLLFLSICVTLAGEWLLLHERDARYLLPLGAPLVFLTGAEFANLVDRRLIPKRLALGCVAGVLLLGATSMREFKDFNFLWTNHANSWSEAKRIRQVLAYLTIKGVSHVYSMNGLLDTQLILYSDEKVIARWTDWRDRYPPYLSAVDGALAQGDPVAVVGYTNVSGAPGCWDVPICTGGIESLASHPDKIFTVDGKYFVYVSPNKDLLEKLGFRLTN